MDGCSQTSKREQSSAKCRPKPIEADFFEVAENQSTIVSDDIGRSQKKCNSKSSEIVSTGDIVSAVGQIWESANKSLARLQPKRSAKFAEIGSDNKNIVCQIGEKEHIYRSRLAENECAQYNIKSSTLFSCSLEQSSEHAKANEITVLDSFSKGFWRSKKDVHTLLTKSWNRKEGEAVGISHEYRTGYGLMGLVSLCTLRQHVPTIHEYEKAIERYMMIDRSEVSGSLSCYKTTLSGHLRNCSSDVSSDMEKGLSSGDKKDAFKNRKMPIPSLSSDYILQVPGEQQSEVGASVASSSVLYAKHVANSPSSSCSYEHHKEGFDGDEDGEMLINNRNTIQCQKLDTVVEHQMVFLSAKKYKHNNTLAKQEHAFSGALAGTFVSLCIHPVDTIKTVIQSCKVEQKSLYTIGQSIVTERGLSGLYRGVASNIATSAPISAIYTFSYETVKGFLLPFLPKEYQSFAHCTAGGCASIATSFIFTPSERIKQQMQVSPRYQNCWNAFLRIIENGGLPSLYTGWGAVLCRNIPHSIIKFYTYESLKQHIFSSDQPKTWQTLLCGGLAGSTAALFSTPFDLVKTRYQTQVPGSAKQYSGVFNAIKQISKTEGVTGLYRGLTPRLVMYMSQGALFFTSYEFFKSMFFSELPQNPP
ncbi:hypothetical protein V2J09_004928 [Rumex salicifolius]